MTHSNCTLVFKYVAGIHYRGLNYYNRKSYCCSIFVNEHSTKGFYQFKYEASYLSLLFSVASVCQTISFLSLGGLFCILKKHTVSVINTLDARTNVFHRKGMFKDIRLQILRGQLIAIKAT